MKPTETYVPQGYRCQKGREYIKCDLCTPKEPLICIKGDLYTSTKEAYTKRPTKKTYKRDLQKRPTKKTYKRDLQKRPTMYRGLL